MGHKTYDDQDKENVDYNQAPDSLHRENHETKMFRINSEDYEEENESSTPEASNEHREADIDIEGHMDQRMMNVNRMGFATRCKIGDRMTEDEEIDKTEELIQYYRSKSQNLNKKTDNGVHPKSHVSSPVEVSNSTMKNKSTVPTTLQSDSI